MFYISDYKYFDCNPHVEVNSCNIAGTSLTSCVTKQRPNDNDDLSITTFYCCIMTYMVWVRGSHLVGYNFCICIGLHRLSTYKDSLIEHVGTFINGQNEYVVAFSNCKCLPGPGRDP